MMPMSPEEAGANLRAELWGYLSRRLPGRRLRSIALVKCACALAERNAIRIVQERRRDGEALP